MKGSLVLFLLLIVHANAFSQISRLQPSDPGGRLKQDILKVGDRTPAFNDGYFARGFDWPNDAEHVEVKLEWIYKDGKSRSKKITIEQSDIKDGQIVLTTN